MAAPVVSTSSLEEEEVKFRLNSRAECDLILVVGFAVGQVAQSTAGGTVNVHFWMT